MPSTPVKKDAQRPQRGNLHANLHLLIRSAKPSAEPQTGNAELSATNTDRQQSKECGVTKRNETIEARRDLLVPKQRLEQQLTKKKKQQKQQQQEKQLQAQKKRKRIANSYITR